MFGDLFVTIAAGILSVLPVQPAPAVAVTATDIESSVVKYIEAYEHRTVMVDCGFDFENISVKQDTPQTFNCSTEDTENQKKFKTVVVVSTKDGKVQISAVVEKNDEPTPSIKPTQVATTKAEPVG